MQVVEAFVSGSLGQAVYCQDGALCIIDAPTAEPREILPNELQWFRAAREVSPAHPEGLPVSIETVRARLNEEIRFFAGLDGLLVGMDSDFSIATRRRGILRAEGILSVKDEVARRVRDRFLVPADTQEWDPAGALALAIENDAKASAECYEPLAEGIIDQLADEISLIVSEKLGTGVDGTRAREAILRSGLLAELASIEPRGDRAAVSALLFRRSQFPKLRAVDASGQILTAIIRRIENRLAPSHASEPAERLLSMQRGVGESDAVEPIDPILVDKI